MRRSTLVAIAVGAALLAAGPLTAGSSFPDRIQLPNGFAPEGIAVAPGGTFYVGSIPTGAIYRGDLRTGAGSVLVEPAAGRAAIGLALDARGRLFVAGGPTGRGFVYDGETGALLASYELAEGSPTFVNDVVVTRGGAFFTDSFRPFLYRIPIASNGSLGSSPEAIQLSGDIVFGPNFNSNGIDATPNGKTLILVQSNVGKLFTVDPTSGVTREIDLGGDDVRAGDGILLDGKTLYVVRNVQNRVAVIELASDLGSGALVGHLTSGDFSVPTTIAEFGSRLYAVNARFGTPVAPATEYWVTQLRKGGG